MKRGRLAGDTDDDDVTEGAEFTEIEDVNEVGEVVNEMDTIVGSRV